MAWNNIDEIGVPRRDVVTVKTKGGKVFRAGWDYDDDGENYFVSWAALHEDEAPPCWTDGKCWGSNADGKPSDPVIAWKP